MGIWCESVDGWGPIVGQWWVGGKRRDLRIDGLPIVYMFCMRGSRNWDCIFVLRRHPKTPSRPGRTKCLQYPVATVFQHHSIKVTVVDGRLESLEMSSHVVPQSAWCLGDDACNVVVNTNNVRRSLGAGWVSPEWRHLWFNWWAVGTSGKI